jgi:hypothetical protein
VGDGLWIAPQNRRVDEDGAGHASRSSGLLSVEASRARVSQFASKLAEARQWVVHVASSLRLSRSSRRWTGRRDGLRQTLLSKIVVFYVLGPRGIFAFCLGL